MDLQTVHKAEERHHTWNNEDGGGPREDKRTRQVLTAESHPGEQSNREEEGRRRSQVQTCVDAQQRADTGEREARPGLHEQGPQDEAGDQPVLEAPGVPQQEGRDLTPTISPAAAARLRPRPDAMANPYAATAPVATRGQHRLGGKPPSTGQGLHSAMIAG